ncbi:MAG TPA: 4a-hydroxytetrahydrobiopterin dehydratase [Vicinamibacterales bacterium]
MANKLQTYDAPEIVDRLASLPGWRFVDGVIQRSYKTDGWPTTLMFVNAIGYCAEGADHHPDLKVSWGKLVVALSTHSAGGVTDKDLDLARRIEDIARWHPAVKGE